MYTCVCKKRINREFKYQEILRVLSESQVIGTDTKEIFIYSKVQEKIEISVNTVKYRLYPGINKICICALYRDYLGFSLRITAHYLTKIEEIKGTVKGKQFYVVKGVNHKKQCKNNRIPSLFDISYNSLLTAGIAEKELGLMSKRGEIPRDVYEKRMPWYNHLGFYSFEDIFNVSIPMTDNIIRSCKKPLQHLNIVGQH